MLCFITVIRVPLQICKNEWDIVGPNGTAADGVLGDEGREASRTGRFPALQERTGMRPFGWCGPKMGPTTTPAEGVGAGGGGEDPGHIGEIEHGEEDADALDDELGVERGYTSRRVHQLAGRAQWSSIIQRTRLGARLLPEGFLGAAEQTDWGAARSCRRGSSCPCRCQMTAGGRTVACRRRSCRSRRPRRSRCRYRGRAPGMVSRSGSSL